MNIDIAVYKSLINKELPLVSNLSNVASLLNKMDNINWCGFYLLINGRLYLGPFQGDVACTTIELGKGVCGTAAKEKKTIIVPDVSKFPGHIACSPISKSEIVVPIIKEDKVKGVIDIDAPILDRFTELDKQYLEEIATLLSELF